MTLITFGCGASFTIIILSSNIPLLPLPGHFYLGPPYSHIHESQHRDGIFLSHLVGFLSDFSFLFFFWTVLHTL